MSLCVLTHVARAADLSGRIVSITDGDTVTLLDSTNTQHKIRLKGIDAPEMTQPIGQKAKSNLAALVFNREVIAECGKPDKYRGEICVIKVEGKDVNLGQVAAGMAWWYRDYAKEQSAQDRENYEIAEFNAKIRRLGLWADTNPVPPWEWRRR
jgi:endonuclease YncB( thermonuclease family)